MHVADGTRTIQPLNIVDTGLFGCNAGTAVRLDAQPSPTEQHVDVPGAATSHKPSQNLMSIDQHWEQDAISLSHVNALTLAPNSLTLQAHFLLLRVLYMHSPSNPSNPKAHA